MVLDKAIFTLSMVFMLVGCMATAKRDISLPECITGSPMTQTTLYFGLSRSIGVDISADEWEDFIDNDVTPRFREGLTILDAKGQWLGNDGNVVHEASKVLILLHNIDMSKNSKIEALRKIYTSRFNQDSVMRVDKTICVSF